MGTRERQRGRRGAGSFRQRGNRWEYRKIVNGERRTFTGATQAEAYDKADAALREDRSHPASTHTLREWFATYLTRKEKQLRPQTYMSYEAHWRLHIEPILGSVRLDALTPDHIDKLHGALLRKVSGTTAHHVHMTLNAALADAMKSGYRVSGALKAVSPPRRSQGEIQTLTKHEVERLLASLVGDPLEALYVLAVTVGMREGELLGLRWQYVDVQNRRLRVMGSVTRTLDGTRAIKEPKTAAGKRTLTLPRLAVDALLRTPRQGSLVWPGPDGGPIPATTLYKRWEAVRDRAGVRVVSFHALRHTAATLALENGQAPHVVAAMLGHSSVATTLRLYAHVTHASTEALADSIDSLYGGSPRLRVVGSVRGKIRGSRKEVPYTTTEEWCRERESNPYAHTGTAP